MDILELKYKDDTSQFRRHPWEIARGKIIKDLVSDTKSPNLQHIADVGCGDLYIGHLLTQQYPRLHYTAIDNALTPAIIDQLEMTKDEVTIYTDISQAIKMTTPADIVLILDVIEHVSDEKKFIGTIKANILTHPDTKWIITVPAFQSLFSRHDVLLGHYRRYNLRQLTALCKNNGLDILEKGYFFFTLALIRKLTRRKQPAGVEKEYTIQHWKGNKVITSILCRTLWMDYKLGTLFNRLGIHLPGLSCYCICQQSPS